MEQLRVPPEMFRFTWTERSELYIAILEAFAEANERLETALSLDDLKLRLRSVGWLGPVDDADLAAALEQLHIWSLVDVIQNHGENYRTASEYERRNLQYSLTRRGEAAFAGISHAVTMLASTGALQTAVLDAISDRLGDLVHEFETGTDRRVFAALFELESHLEALRANTKQFNGELQRLLRADGADLATFHEVKASIVVYLQEFLTNLDYRSHAIAERIAAIEDGGVGLMHKRALAGAELPSIGGDPGPAWLEHRRIRWAGLRAWFWPEDEAPPRVEQLQDVGRRAIITLLQALDRITESRRRTSSAVADFRELARWFEVAPEQDDLHRLWSTMFGLRPSRHAHLAHPDPELVSSARTWAEAPPVEVSPLLRSAGRVERFTRTGRVRDVAKVKAERAQRARAERAELEAAWSRLDTAGASVRLSAFGSLDHALFERLLELLGRALMASADRTGARRTTTSDGRIEIVLRPPADPGLAELSTPLGTFRGPDYEVEVRGAGRSHRPRRAAGGQA
jgi:uncharacterized protein (TIGR02677 family)